MANKLWRVPAIMFGSGMLLYLAWVVANRLLAGAASAQGLATGLFLLRISLSVALPAAGGLWLLRRMTGREILAGAALTSAIFLVCVVLDAVTGGGLTRLFLGPLSCMSELGNWLLRLSKSGAAMVLSIVLATVSPFLLCLFALRSRSPE